MQIESTHIFSMRKLIISWPWALLGSKPLTIFSMSLSVKEMLDRDLTVKILQLVESSLVFVINEHWLAKKELNSSVFSIKLVMNLLSWKIGRMQGTFLPVKKPFKIDKYVFELVLGSDNFWAVFEIYFCFEVSSKLLKFQWN